MQPLIAQCLDTDPLYMTSGRQPLYPAAPFRLGIVRDGRVNLFIELVDENGKPRGVRHHFATLEAGEAFCVPLDILGGARFVVVGIGEAHVALLDAVQRASMEADAPVDAWLKALTAVCVGGTIPASSKLALHGETVAIRAGDIIAARDPAWLVSAELAALPIVANADVLRDKHLLGLVTPHCTVTAKETLVARALSSADAIRLFGWDFLDDVATDLMRTAAHLIQSNDHAAAERRAHSREISSHVVDGALRRLTAVIDSATSGARAENAVGSSAKAAVAAVCVAEKIPFDEATIEGTHPDSITAVRELLRGAGIRSRRVTLEDGWWRSDTSSFVAFHATTGAPVAVIRKGAACYEFLDPETGTQIGVDRSIAGQLGNQAVFAVRLLPQRPLTKWDLVRLVLSSPARMDLKVAVLLAALTAGLGLLPPIITGLALNESVPFSETSSLLAFSIGLVMIAVGSAMFQLGRAIALARIEAFADGTLQAAVWDRLLRLPIAFFRRFETGDLLIKAMAPTQLRKVLSDMALTSALAALFAPLNFVLMLTYDVRLAAAAAGVTLVTCCTLFGLSYLQLRFERTRLKAEASANSLTLQLLAGIQKLRLMGAENRAFARWLDAFGAQRVQTVRAARVGNVIATTNRVLPVIASAIFMAVIGFASSDISPGSFVAFTAAFGVFNGALLGFVGAVSTSLAVIPMVENITPLLDEQPESDGERRKPAPLAGRIDLRNVSFRYQQDGPLVLNGIDISIAPGEFVAFVGASGSGKSTLFRLLLGFEQPLSGTVAYDGQDLAHLDLKAVRRQLGVVLQRGTILPGSIFQNIVGSAPLSQDDAWEAARMAGFEDDIRNMPMGMHTVLSDNATTLSGGQRQRLMIARAIVRRPAILLMDEATSALDNRTQAIVAESLSRLSATRIVIAHRLSTVINADRIFVMGRGAVLQQGTFAQLMAEPGPFRDIALPQMR